MSVVGDGSLFQDRRRASSFGEHAEQYDRVRPAYPEELIDTLLADGPSAVLDIGCGTGITARLFAGRGCEVLGIEPDPRMAAVARRRGSVVEEGSFEQWAPAGRQFDLLVAGQAWHWVEPKAGADRAAAALRPGGRIGLFWNQSFPDPAVRQVIDEVYDRLLPDLGANAVLLGRRDDRLYDRVVDSLRDSGHFEQVEVRRFAHAVRYTTAAWLELAATHSDHRTLPPDELAGLFDALGPALDAAGGEVPVQYETTLVTGRRRSD
jgi:SAM-dependent methyltransferase